MAGRPCSAGTTIAGRSSDLFLNSQNGVTVMGIGDGVVAVGTRHLWWRLAEAAGNMPWVKYGSLAQGLRRLWRLAEERGELKEFVAGMWDKCK